MQRHGLGRGDGGTEDGGRVGGEHDQGADHRSPDPKGGGRIGHHEQAAVLTGEPPQPGRVLEAPDDHLDQAVQEHGAERRRCAPADHGQGSAGRAGEGAEQRNPERRAARGQQPVGVRPLGRAAKDRGRDELRCQDHLGEQGATEDRGGGD